MKIGVALTTINIPYILEEQVRLAQMYSKNEIIFVVAGDKKTPTECRSYCESLSRDTGYDIVYLDLKDQNDEYPSLSKYIPLNSISRRNFATLKAYQLDADIIIMVDDDNFPLLDDDYFGKHSKVGSEQFLNVINSESNWFNVCEVLLESNQVPFYHRGFPINKRSSDSVGKDSVKKQRIRIASNEGLWIDSPDTDAFTWMNAPELTVTNYHRYMYGSNFALSRGTWSPMNSQNTSILREGLPSYFLNPFHKRYDDIWAGYIFQKVAKSLNYSIVFGEPLVEQRRNPHDYLVDLENEMDGIKNTPKLIDELFNIELGSKNFVDGIQELIASLSSYFGNVKSGYEMWLSQF